MNGFRHVCSLEFVYFFFVKFPMLMIGYLRIRMLISIKVMYRDIEGDLE